MQTQPNPNGTAPTLAEKRPRFYIGITPVFHVRFMFTSAETPTAESHGTRFSAVIGPFRTKRGAEYMRDNRYCDSVAHAERAALVSASQHELCLARLSTFSR